MAQPPSSDKVAAGRARLAAQARRISVLRRRVVASMLATFAMAWSVVAFTGSMGNTTIASTTTTAGSGATTSTTDESSVAATATATPTATATANAAPTATATSSSSSSGSAASLTTSQS